MQPVLMVPIPTFLDHKVLVEIRATQEKLDRAERASMRLPLRPVLSVPSATG